MADRLHICAKMNQYPPQIKNLSGLMENKGRSETSGETTGDLANQPNEKKTGKRLPPTDTFLDIVAPLAKQVRITYEVPVRRVFQVYRGTSSYGPCVFYHHPRTDTWVALFRNQQRRSRLLPILTTTTSNHPLVCTTIRNLLGNPMKLNDNVVSRSPDQDHEDWKLRDLWHVFLPGFIRAHGQGNGSWRDVFRGIQKAPNARTRPWFGGLQQVCNDGDIVWAVWRPSGALRQQIRDRFSEEIVDHILSYVGDMPQAGFTGFYQINLRLEDGGKYVRCQNNSSFWAKRLEGPVHYCEEEHDLNFRPPTPPTQIQPDEDEVEPNFDFRTV